MLDWSYGLLSEGERAMLTAVCVFAGVFDIDGASDVSGLDASDTSEVLAQLAAKSLLATDLDAEGVAYRFLETTRAYCLERLLATGEAETVYRRHAEHVCKVLDRAAKEWVQRPALEWGQSYARTLDDLRNALAWAERDERNRMLAVRLTVAGTLIWNHFSLTSESRSRVSKAIEHLDTLGLAGTAAEMQLQLSLAGTTLFARGLTPVARDAMRRALDIAVRLDDAEYHLRSLRMIGVYELFVGEHKGALQTLEAFAAVAAAKDPSSLVDGEAHLSLAEIYAGRLRRPRQRLERLYQHESLDFKDPRFVRFLYDRNVDFGNVLSNVQWLTGAPDTAMRTAEATVQWALKINHGLSLSNALAVAACPVAFWSGQYQEASRYVAMLEDQVNQHGIVMWRPTAAFYRGAIACATSDDPSDGIKAIRSAIAEFASINHMSRMPFILGELASALVKCGRLDEAAETISSAIDRARAQGDVWCVPELLRIQAAVLASEGHSEQAESSLSESISLAKQIDALSWHMRSANDLATLWLRQSRTREARELVKTVHCKFVEGFESQDLKRADHLLALTDSR